MNTHNLCFEQKYEKYQSFLSENFQFLEVKFSIYLNRHIFVTAGYYFYHDLCTFLFYNDITLDKRGIHISIFLISKKKRDMGTH